MSATDETPVQDQFRLEEVLSCSIPTSRVKKICRLDPDLSMISNDAVLFITKATELFVTELAKASYTQAVLEKRKTIQTKDLNRAIATRSTFDFLEGALSGWPEGEVSKSVSQATLSLEESIVEEEDMVDTSTVNVDETIDDVVPDSLTLDFQQDGETNVSEMSSIQ